MSKVAALKDDLSYALATTEIRILAPIPGKQAVGVEVPNLTPNLVTLGDIYDDLPQTASPLAVWLGKDISGNAVWTDLARMPHILIAGTTGSGKSGCINTILTSVLLRATPDEVRMILIDPKRIELSYYEQIPHLLAPVVSSPKEATAVLANVINEMERRYEQLSKVRARNLPEANRALRERGEPPLPYLLVVIDELADLMMISPQAVEDAIIRLAQKSRAVGIHLVLATQRPSVDVITGMIKANVPSRIAFAVSSQTDSRVIIDQGGAESLLGQGDMLFKPLGTSRLQRVQGAYVGEEEVALVVEQCRGQREQELDASLLEAPEPPPEEADAGDEEFDPDEDPLLDRAIEIVVQAQTASTSLLQRRLRVGYTRAGRLIDMLERRGIISGYEGSKPRRVLVDEAQLDRVLSLAPPPPTGLASPSEFQVGSEEGCVSTKRWTWLLVVVSALFLAVGAAGCGGDDDGGGGGDKIKVGLVTDTGGVDDRGFNQFSIEGLDKAESELDIEKRVYVSNSADDYEPNLEAAVDDGNDFVVAVGFLLAPSAIKVATAEPGRVVRGRRPLLRPAGRRGVRGVEDVRRRQRARHDLSRRRRRATSPASSRR